MSAREHLGLLAVIQHYADNDKHALHALVAVNAKWRTRVLDEHWEHLSVEALVAEIREAVEATRKFDPRGLQNIDLLAGNADATREAGGEA